MRKIFTLLLLIIFIKSSFGQTVLPSIISRDTVLLKLNSPYIINTSTLVSDNITLTIEAGVDITITGALNVRGIILALGAENDSIRFHCNNSTAPSIRIIKGTNDTLNAYSKFNYCSIRSNNVGIYSYNRKININNSSISNCLSDGLQIENGALRVSQSKIERNLGNGIFTISDYIFQIALDSCFISTSSISFNNGAGVDWGLFRSSQFNSINYNVSLTGNMFVGNGKEGLRLNGNGLSFHIAYIYDNIFKENKSFAIYSGLQGSSFRPTNLVFYNIFTKNKGTIVTNGPSKLWNNIFVGNYTNITPLNPNTSYKPELFDFKTSVFFSNNIVAYNQFENLVTYTIGDSLSLNRNLFYFNKPTNNLVSSTFFLETQNTNATVQWNKYKFTGNNFFMDQTSNY